MKKTYHVIVSFLFSRITRLFASNTKVAFVWTFVIRTTWTNTSFYPAYY